MSKVVAVPEGVEAWKNCNDGVVAYRFYDQGGREVIRQVPGGQVFRLTAVARQMIEDAFIRQENNIFANGTLKRVDNRIAAPADDRADVIDGADVDVPVEDGKTTLPVGYDEEQAMDVEDLRKIFEKNGNAFQSAVKGLSEGRARRLLALSLEEDSTVTVKQSRFLEEYVSSTFQHGKSSRTVVEMQSEVRK